ncbi:MAG: hypothetical protein IJ536_05835, partial [Acidaminococcaceae bacterium]|nr:hypothetical protein [Acidaminococcaceae bacterium]
NPGTIPNITSFLESNGIKVKTINVSNRPLKKQVVLELYLKINRETDLGYIMGGLQQIEGVKSLENIG